MPSMKNTISITLIVLVILSAFTFIKPESYIADTKKSKLSWVGYKVGSKQYGDLNLNNGYFVMNGNELTGGSFTMDMNSITVKNVQGKQAEELLSQLRSEEFFGVAKYATAQFQFTKATSIGANKYDITGKLTIKNTTKDITFPAVVVSDGKNLTAKGTLIIDREKWNIVYRDPWVGTSANNLIGNNIEISLNIIANKN